MSILLVIIKGTAISTLYNVSSIFYLAIAKLVFSIKLKIVALILSAQWFKLCPFLLCRFACRK